MARLLEVKGLTKRFGGLIAVNDVSLRRAREGDPLGDRPERRRQVHAVQADRVVPRPSAGEVLLRGERISDLAPHIVARKGVVRTFQETTIFKGMSVRDNVIIAHHLRSQRQPRSASSSAPARPARTRQSFGQLGRRDPRLSSASAAIASELARNLPHGHLRALGIAIGLATNPTDPAARRALRRHEPRRDA